VGHVGDRGLVGLKKRMGRDERQKGGGVGKEKGRVGLKRRVGEGMKG
jgi:hypothetical protein